MPRPTVETVMEALLAALQATGQVAFTAGTTQGSGVLSSPSSTQGLLKGAPVFGPGIARGSLISALTPDLTLSLPATAGAAGVNLTAGFVLFGRRVIIDPPAQPALFLRDGDEDLTWQGQNQLQMLRGEIWVLSNLANADLAPIIPLNNLLEIVRSTFAPDSGTGQFTLGGLVSWCRMGGKVLKDPGDVSDGNAIAVADVEIFVP